MARAAGLLKLPNELLDHVLGYDNLVSSLQNISLVNSKLSAVARRQLFQQLVIKSSTNRPNIALQVSKILHTLQNDEQRARDVRCLSLSVNYIVSWLYERTAESGPERNKAEDNFLDLLGCLTNLRELHIKILGRPSINDNEWPTPPSKGEIEEFLVKVLKTKTASRLRGMSLKLLIDIDWTKPCEAISNLKNLQSFDFDGLGYSYNAHRNDLTCTRIQVPTHLLGTAHFTTLRIVKGNIGLSWKRLEDLLAWPATVTTLTLQLSIAYEQQLACRVNSMLSNHKSTLKNLAISYVPASGFTTISLSDMAQLECFYQSWSWASLVSKPVGTLCSSLFGAPKLATVVWKVDFPVIDLLHLDQPASARPYCWWGELLDKLARPPVANNASPNHLLPSSSLMTPSSYALRSLHLVFLANTISYHRDSVSAQRVLQTWEKLFSHLDKPRGGQFRVTYSVVYDEGHSVVFDGDTTSVTLGINRSPVGNVPGPSPDPIHVRKQVKWYHRHLGNNRGGGFPRGLPESWVRDLQLERENRRLDNGGIKIFRGEEGG